MEAGNNYRIDLRKIGSLLWQHLALIAVVAVVCALSGFCIAQYAITPTYNASADMLVNNSQDRATGATITSADITASNNLVGTYAIVLKSHTILEQVIRNLQLDRTYDELAKQVSVSSVSSTQVMRITVEDENAASAVEIVSEIVRLALDVSMDTIEAGSVKMVDTPWTTGKPVAPSKMVYTAAAGLLGLIVSVCAILLRDILNNTFKTDEDVRNILDLPVIGVIPLESDTVQRKARNTQKGGH